MDKIEKELLFKDICARLPYGVNVLADIDKTFDGGCIGIINRIEPYVGNKFPELKGQYLLYAKSCLTPLVVDEVKPYLRPLSSMTEKECKELGELITIYDDVDWMLAHHFDVHNLIEKGLALEASEEMYKVE